MIKNLDNRKAISNIIFILAVAVISIIISILLLKTKSIAAPDMDDSFAVTASSILIDAATVKYTATLPEMPVSDDNQLYLFEMPVYVYEINDQCKEIEKIEATTNPEITFSLNHKQSTSRLYKKFALCVKSGDDYLMIAKPQYITNPELLARHTHERTQYPLKGIQGVDFGNLILSPEYEAITNPAALYPIVCIVNNGGNQLLTSPDSRKNASDSHYIDHDNFMFNCTDAIGVNVFASKLENIAAAAIRTDDWVVGNEVNERVCNYTVWIGWDEFMKQYEQEFRVAYIAIKSQNANAGVYISLDQKWNMEQPANSVEYYSFINVKEFLEKFASDIKESGDVNWGICQHPYTVPLVYAKFWDMSGCPNGNYFKGLVDNDKMISFQNQTAIISYIEQEQFLNSEGKVRNLLLSEIGIADAQGASVQAATLCASYIAAERQPAVARIIYLSADCGVFNATFTPEAQEMYDNMDGENKEEYRAKALKTIGVSDWDAILR